MQIFAGEKDFAGNLPDNSLEFQKLCRLRMLAKADKISFSGRWGIKVL
jgi:hypothetical protein